jgi:hypothetical protein
MSRRTLTNPSHHAGTPEVHSLTFGNRHALTNIFILPGVDTFSINIRGTGIELHPLKPVRSSRRFVLTSALIHEKARGRVSRRGRLTMDGSVLRSDFESVS